MLLKSLFKSGPAIRRKVGWEPITAASSESTLASNQRPYSPLQLPENIWLSPGMVPRLWPFLFNVNSFTGYLCQSSIRLRLSPSYRTVWRLFSSILFFLILLPQVSDQYHGLMGFLAYSWSPIPLIFHEQYPQWISYTSNSILVPLSLTHTFYSTYNGRAWYI